MIDISAHITDRYINYPTILVSKIIQEMNNYGEVVLVSREAFSGEENGLYKLLDQLCFYWGWDKKKITIKTSNQYEKHLEYQVVINKSPAFLGIHHKPKNLTFGNVTWDGSKYYGQFLGRITGERGYGYVRHANFEFNRFGLTSLSQWFTEDAAQNKDIIDFFRYSDWSWSKIKQVQVYSDINDVISPPITFPHNIIGWENVYKQIPIEIVFETHTAENIVAPTEKILRPMLYHRPFMLVASPQLIDYLEENYDIRFFQSVIPLTYKYLKGKERVDVIYDILHDLIKSGKIQTLLHDLKEDIDHNYKIAKQLVETEPDNTGLTPHKWHKPYEE